MTTQVHDFYTYSKPLGLWGEEQVMRRFQAAQWQVADLRKDPFGQMMDIDFIAISPLGGAFNIEVKADRYPNTMYIEEWSRLYDEPAEDGSLGEPGCLFYTQADYIVYYLVTQGYALVVPVRPLREWMERRLHDFPAKNPLTSDHLRGPMRSQGRPVPLQVIQAEVPGTYVMTGLPIWGATNYE